jgi:hypothetical protein
MFPTSQDFLTRFVSLGLIFNEVIFLTSGLIFNEVIFLTSGLVFYEVIFLTSGFLTRFAPYCVTDGPLTMYPELVR